MRARIAGLCAIALSLGACSTSSADTFDGQRTVFNNPLAPMKVENSAVGADCANGEIRGDQCIIGGVAYPLGKRAARLLNGEIVRLTKKERDLLRQRDEAIRSRQDVLESLKSGAPIPANPPALPENQRQPAPGPGAN